MRPRGEKRGLLAIAPLYIWTVLLVLIPVIYVLILSVSTRGETYGVVYQFSVDAYKAIVDPTVLMVIVKSLKVAALTTVFTLLIGYPFAYAMATRPKKWRNLLLLLVIVPFWTSSLLRIYGWMIFLRSNGMFNELLMALGVISSPVKYLYNDGAVLFGMIYSFLPFMILPVYSSIEKLEPSIREAARDLGANPVITFLTVTLPLTLPGVVSGFVMVFVPSVGMFFISDLMGGGTDMLLGNLISHYLHGGRNWPLGAVLSMVMVAMTFFTMSVYRRFSDGGDLGVF